MRAALVVVALLGVATPAHADDPAPDQAPPPPKTPFDRGKFNLSVGGGSQKLLDQSYFAIGASAGYFVLDGVEIGLGGLHEFGGSPSISKLTPMLEYVAQPLVGKTPVIPYVATFYNHWFIGGQADVDTVGGRAGLLYVSGQLVLGLGAAYERIVSKCVMNCSSIYPDVTVSLAL
jgi:hypothetical protein